MNLSILEGTIFTAASFRCASLRDPDNKLSGPPDPISLPVFMISCFPVKNSVNSEKFGNSVKIQFIPTQKAQSVFASQDDRISKRSFPAVSEGKPSLRSRDQAGENPAFTNFLKNIRLRHNGLKNRKLFRVINHLTHKASDDKFRP